jgi:type IV secretion system protein TrbL
VTPDAGILTTLLNTFSDSFTNGLGLINGDARWILGTLMIIDLLLAVLLNLSDGDHMKTLISKILKYGFFIWLVMDYRQLVNVVLESFEMVGLKAGGGGLSAAMLSDPSNIASYGIWVTAPIFEFINNLSGTDVMFNLHKIMFSGFTGLIIMLCFFIIGIQIFITYLEFYVVATLALILLPFGVNKHTAFLGEKAIGAVLSFGIKLMVLAFIASVAIPLVKTWSIPADPTTDQIFCLLLGSLAITFLAWHAPGVASGLLSGHPTLTGGSAAGFALAGGLAATGMGMAGATAKNAAVAATKAAAGGAGQLAGAYGAGGMGGVASLAKDKVSGLAHSATGGLRDSFTSGKDHGASVATGGGGGGPTTGSTSSGSGSSPPPRRTAGELAQKLVYVKNSIPPESGGGGSATPNLNRGGE